MCFFHDGDCEFVLDREVRARKPHRCEECSRGVRVGETYTRTSGKFEGEIFWYATCARCEAMRVLVHEYELARGCAWSESWPPSGCLTDALADYRREHGEWAADDETWTSVWPDGLPDDVAAVAALGEALRAKFPALAWKAVAA